MSPAEAAARYVAGIRDAEKCIVWAFGQSGGYGALRVNRKQMRATHFVLELSGRPRPDGAHALHSCDNPPCINPSHLRWGTHAENMADRTARGRAPRGPRVPHGTATMYGRHKCRCGDCRAAWAAYQRERRRKNREQVSA